MKEQQIQALREQYAGQVLAAFCANPAVFAENDRTGWGLVNCTHEQLVELADVLAHKLARKVVR
jgi:hypothetical protein